MKPRREALVIVAPLQADGHRYVTHCPFCGEQHRHGTPTGGYRAGCNDPRADDVREYTLVEHELQRQIALMRVRRDSPSEDFKFDCVRDRHMPADPAKLASHVEMQAHGCESAVQQAKRFAKRLMTNPG